MSKRYSTALTVDRGVAMRVEVFFDCNPQNGRGAGWDVEYDGHVPSILALTEVEIEEARQQIAEEQPWEDA